jgi:anhydro-N-acetylmuramic acid kinase
MFMAQIIDKDGRSIVLGLMSGTSMDGLDMCLVDFKNEDPTNYQILRAETLSYTSYWQHALIYCELTKTELEALDEAYSLELARMVNDFLVRHELCATDIDLIASHGHTWFHQPENALTFQIGNRPSLAQETGILTICDFRVSDVSLGGQGAPLVPIGDRDLFGEYEACINLGGFANISLDRLGSRQAWDISPCNIGLNYYCQKLGLPYDDEGYIAASYNSPWPLVANLNALSYYQEKAPKSLGREWFEKEFLSKVEVFDCSIEEKIASLTQHTAFQIARELKEHKINKVLFSGGGAYNKCLIDTIGLYGDFELIIAPAMLLDFKEALIFAYLGLLRSQNKINVLASVTGALHDHSSGNIFKP